MPHRSAPPMRPDISVIVPHLNDIGGLQQCLTLLAEQIVPGHAVEIIVADNGSDCGPAALEAAIAGRARLVIAPERGAGPARNAGVAAASGHILAFIDSDCQPDRNWLSAGIAALDRADIIGGSVVIIKPVGRSPNGAESFESVFAFNMEDYVKRKGFAGSGNLFVRRSDFLFVGGFVTGKSEDMEWSHRATSKGLTLDYEPAALVFHPPRRNWIETRNKWLRVTEEMFQVAKDKNFGRLKWFIKCIALPPSAIFHLPKIIFCESLPARSRLNGSLMLVRIRVWRMIYGISLLLKK